MKRLHLVLLLVLTGCSSDGDASDRDAGTVLVRHCVATGALDSLRCPAGCVSVEANVIDTAGACVTSETLVIACYSEDATVYGDTATQCFHHVEDPSLVVRAPSDRIRVEGLTDDLLVYSGWVRCAEEVAANCP